MPMSPRLLRPRAASGFTPKAISGLSAWYDASVASSVTITSGFVSQWNDLSGGGLVTLFGYLLAGLVLLPIGFVWSLAERSRGATAVLCVAGLAQAFVVVRVLQVWPS